MSTPRTDSDVSLVRSFQLRHPPHDFIDDPYRYYALLRMHDPVHELEGGALFLTRYDDVVEIYRHSAASSDKKQEFRPKFGDSALYEHHTTSLVFNDPPCTRACAASSWARSTSVRSHAWSPR